MAQTTDEQWHYERDGKTVGPVERAVLQDLASRNLIGPDTLVCKGEGQWLPARKTALSFPRRKRDSKFWISLGTSPFVLILVVNVLVYIAMVVKGVAPLNPSVSDLLKWGANFGPRTTSGEWWRLLTSTFVHIGLLHLFFNMIVLLQIGLMMQSLMGRAGFTIAYFVSGFAGSLVSLIWNPYAASAGASGAIFGLYGALLGYALVQRGSMPREALSGLVLFAAIFIGYNVVYGLARPGTDMAAHAGGLAGGFVSSLALCANLKNSGRVGHAVRNVVVVSAAAILIVVVASQIPRSVDLQAELKQFAGLEIRTQKKFTDAAQEFRKGKMDGIAFANVVEKDVLPDWIAEHDVMNWLKGLPERQSRVVSLLVRYIELRREAWSDFAQGARTNRVDKLKEAAEKQHEAELVLKEIDALGKSR